MPQVGSGSGSVSSAGIVDGTIIDADINAAAAIQRSKLKTSDFSFKCGSVSYETSTASGNYNIAHGLGRTPVRVRITGMFNQSGSAESCFAFTSYDGTTQASCHCAVGDVDNDNVDGTEFRLYAGSAQGNGNYVTGTVTFDGTNIIIAWTKTGTPSGTAKLVWEAY